MLWNSNVSHEEKAQIIADLARIICYAERPTVNPGALELPVTHIYSFMGLEDQDAHGIGGLNA
jgi:hypothetical protein